MGAYSHIHKLSVKELAVGTPGAEVPVVDCDGFLVQPEAHTTGTVGTTGRAASVPSRPVGYLIVQIGSEQFKVPYYNM